MEKNWQNFRYTSVAGIYHPFLMKGMKEAVERVIKAINEREKIVIYGCCDVDGIVGTSLLFLVLKYLNADVEYFIPDEVHNNYNISATVIKNHITFLGANLIVTVGCGTNSAFEVKLCEKLGIDVIITDYHAYETEIKEAILVNPNQKGCAYPFKELVGVGVAYKLVEAVSMYYNMKCIHRYIDLVMIGTLAHHILLKDENRIIVDKGLVHFKKTNNRGIKSFIKINQLTHIDEEQVWQLIKMITPTVNAIGSMDNARIAVEFFTTSDIERAEQIAKYLNRKSGNAKNIHTNTCSLAT